MKYQRTNSTIPNRSLSRSRLALVLVWIWVLIKMLFVDKITWLSTEIMHESTALFSFEYLNNEDHLKLVHIKVWNSYYECSILLPGSYGNFKSASKQQFCYYWIFMGVKPKIFKLKILLSEISEIAFKDINRLIHVIKDSKFTYPRWNILKPTLVWNIRSCITEVSSNWTRKEIKLSKISRYFSIKDGEMKFLRPRWWCPDIRGRSGQTWWVVDKMYKSNRSKL